MSTINEQELLQALNTGEQRDDNLKAMLAAASERGDEEIRQIEQLARRDVTQIKAKNEREHCYSLMDISDLCEEHATRRYGDGPDAVFTKEVYRVVFCALAQYPGQES